jgi:hypothetical protein
MTTERYKLPVYLSDLAGNDALAHHGRPEAVIELVRRYLHTRPDGKTLPGSTRIVAEFQRFKSKLPELAAALEIAPHEIDPYRDYRVYIGLIAEFLKIA